MLVREKNLHRFHCSRIVRTVRRIAYVPTARPNVTMSRKYQCYYYYDVAGIYNRLEIVWQVKAGQLGVQDDARENCITRCRTKDSRDDKEKKILKIE